MSVLKCNRSESKAIYVYTAYKIYIETINFLSRLSSRYSRLLSAQISALASEVMSNAEKANNIYPSDNIRKELRERHLLEARASLSALDIQLSLCYEIMMCNPSGCFTNSKGKDIEPSTAKQKIEKIADRLGKMIADENKMITAVLKSDKSR